LSSPRADQAAGLRRLVGQRAARTFSVFGAAPRVTARVLATLVAALAERGERVTVIDEHQGEHGVAGALGCATRRDLAQILSGDANLGETLLSPVPGVRILPAARAARLTAEATAAQVRATAKLLHELALGCDLVIVHAARMAGRPASGAALSAQRRVLCIGADAGGITAGYRLLKDLAACGGRGEVRALMAGGTSAKLARAAFANLRALAADRLGMRLDWLAWVGAAALSHPFTLDAPHSPPPWQELVGALAAPSQPDSLPHDVPGPAHLPRAASRSQRITQAEI